MPGRRACAAPSRESRVPFRMRISHAVAFSLALAASAVSQPMTFQGLGHLGAPPGELVSLAYGISGDGSTVVGRSFLQDSPVGFQAGFRWTQGSGLQALTSTETGRVGDARGVSLDGSVVVGSSSTTLGSGYRWTAASGLVPLGAVSGATFSNPTATSWDGNTVVGVSGSQAFRWTPGGGMVGLGYLPEGTFSSAQGVQADGSTVVGYALTPSTHVAFRWTQSSGMQALGTSPGWSLSEAHAVSADGLIAVGYAQPPAGPARAVLWDALGVPTDLGPGHIYACSADASVLVGQDGISSSALLWDSAGVHQLDQVLSAVLPIGWSLTRAVAISADGRTIAGYGGNPQGQFEAWVATIPEPGVGVLLLAFVGLARRRARL